MPRLIDARRKYTDVCAGIMRELNIEDLDAARALAVDAAEEFRPCWDEFVEWVLHGDDQRAKTLDVIRASMEFERMWR